MASANFSKTDAMSAEPWAEERKCETQDTSHGFTGSPARRIPKRNDGGFHVVKGALWTQDEEEVRIWAPSEKKRDETN